MAINFINSPQGRSQKEKVLRQLQVDLEWQAKALAFKLITKRTTFLYEPMTPGGYLTVDPSSDKKGVQNPLGPSFNLLNDKKFLALSKNIGEEYKQAFANLAESVPVSDSVTRTVKRS